MKQLKKELLDAKNPFGSWLEDNVVRTDDPNDIVSLGDLRVRYYQHQNHRRNYNEFVGLVKRYFHGNGATVIERYRKEGNVRLRNVVVGYRMRGDSRVSVSDDDEDRNDAAENFDHLFDLIRRRKL